jgi:hypothetical protein
MTKTDPLTDQANAFATSVMNKIENEKIQTHSRLRFILHDAAFWSLWFLSALLGAFALSAIVFVLQSSSWQLYLITHDSFLSYATNTIPFLWLVLFLIMVILAHVNLRHTPKGYRYSSLLLIVLNLAVTVLVAIIITAAGLGKFVDEEVGKHLPLYVPAHLKQDLDWFKPEQGLVIGTVVSADQITQIFILDAPDDSDFDVDGRLLSGEEWQMLKVPEVKVRVIGVPETEPFVACIILPVPSPAFVPMHLDYAERKFLEPRSIECRGVRPYDRFDQINHW